MEHVLQSHGSDLLVSKILRRPASQMSYIDWEFVPNHVLFRWCLAQLKLNAKVIFSLVLLQSESIRIDAAHLYVIDVYPSQCQRTISCETDLWWPENRTPKFPRTAQHRPDRWSFHCRDNCNTNILKSVNLIDRLAIAERCGNNYSEFLL